MAEAKGASGTVTKDMGMSMEDTDLTDNSGQNCDQNNQLSLKKQTTQVAGKSIGHMQRCEIEHTPPTQAGVKMTEMTQILNSTNSSIKSTTNTKEMHSRAEEVHNDQHEGCTLVRKHTRKKRSRVPNPQWIRQGHRQGLQQTDQ